MDRGSVAVLLSSVALAGFVVLYLKLDALEDRVDATRSAADRDRVTEEVVDHGGSDARPDARDSKVSPVDASEDSFGKLEEAKNSLTRDELKKEIQALEARLEKRKPGRKRKPIRRSKQLARMLELTSTQKDRIDAIVEDGRRRADEILRTPGNNGRTPLERRDRLREMVREAVRTGEWQAVLAEMKEPSPQDQRIPGRDTTYGEAIARVTDETRRQIVNSLGPDQRERLGDTPLDPALIGGRLDALSIVGAAKEEAFEEARERR